MSRYTLEPFDLNNATYQKPGGGWVCGIGGSSGGSTASSSKNESKENSDNFDDDHSFNNAGDALSADGGGSITLQTQTTTLDGGAIAGAFDLVKSADAGNSRDFNSLLNTTGTALSKFIDGSNKQQSTAMAAVGNMQGFMTSALATAKGEMDSKTVMVLGLAGAAVVGFVLLKGKK
jgi:hypothetical protein